jgi:hypothetical protein
MLPAAEELSISDLKPGMECQLLQVCLDRERMKSYPPISQHIFNLNSLLHVHTVSIRRNSLLWFKTFIITDDSLWGSFLFIDVVPFPYDLEDSMYPPILLISRI